MVQMIYCLFQASLESARHGCVDRMCFFESFGFCIENCIIPFLLSLKDLRKQVLESAKKIHQMENVEAENFKNLEKRAQISQWEFDALKMRLQDFDVKLMKFEGHFKTSIDEKSRKFQELYLEITKLKTEEDNLRECYDDNLKKMRNDANAAEKEQLKCISQEVEKINELIVRLRKVQSSFDGFKIMMTERLLVFSGKVQCLEQEMKDLRDFESMSMQRIEGKYLESMRHHELCLQEAKQEALSWREEFDHKQRKCMELEALDVPLGLNRESYFKLHI